MKVRRYLGRTERYGFGPSHLPDLIGPRLPLRVGRRPEADRRAALQVRQRKRGSPVTAVGCSEKREKRLVLRYGDQLPVAERIGFRLEAEAGDISALPMPPMSLVYMVSLAIFPSNVLELMPWELAGACVATAE